MTILSHFCTQQATRSNVWSMKYDEGDMRVVFELVVRKDVKHFMLLLLLLYISSTCRWMSNSEESNRTVTTHAI